MRGCITDVKGIKVGQVSDPRGITGITVVLSEKGATGSCFVIGGAPGTRETDLLNPRNMVEKVHAVFLAGGSAFGLDAASGIVHYLEEKGAGFDTGVAKVPIVTGAILFDLAIGGEEIAPTSHRTECATESSTESLSQKASAVRDYRPARPTPEMAYQACKAASDTEVLSGNVGAGTGATVGKLLGPDFAMKSGIGTSSLHSKNGFTCGVIVAVNALGNIYHPITGKMVAGVFDRKRRILLGEKTLWLDGSWVTEEVKKAGAALQRTTEGAAPDLLSGVEPAVSAGAVVPCTNTTIGVVAVDAIITKAECQRIAVMAAGGISRCIRPSFTPFDGDTVFVLSTGEKHINDENRSNVMLELGYLAQECFSLAILDSVLSSGSLGGVPGARDLALEET